MARKPNYVFERKVRERLKADKKAKRAADKREAQERKAGQREPSVLSAQVWYVPSAKSATSVPSAVTRAGSALSLWLPSPSWPSPL